MFGAIAFLVIFASILAVNALHTLMRRGEATRVTSLLYLTPIIAVALEWVMFDVRPTLLTTLGIAVTCMVAHLLINGQAKKILADVELTSSKLTNLLTTGRSQG